MNKLYLVILVLCILAHGISWSMFVESASQQLRDSVQEQQEKIEIRGLVDSESFLDHFRERTLYLSAAFTHPDVLAPMKTASFFLTGCILFCNHPIAWPMLYMAACAYCRMIDRLIPELMREDLAYHNDLNNKIIPNLPTLMTCTLVGPKDYNIWQ